MTQELGIRVKIDGSRAKIGANQVSQSLNKVESSARKVGRETKGAQSGIDGMAAALGRMGAAAIAVYTAIGSGRAIVDATLQWQSYEVILKTVTGSTLEAGKALDFVKDEAERLGLSVGALAPSFAQLAAAAKGTSIEGAETKEIFTAISEASAVMRLSADDTRGAMTALIQMLGKGKVSAEELRGQLGERIPGAFQIASRAMGVTTQELDDMLNQGQLFADDFLPRFADQLQKEMAGGINEATTSAQASFNRLGNSFKELLIAIGESGIVDVIATITRDLTKLVKAIEKFIPKQEAANIETLTFAEQLAESQIYLVQQQTELARLNSLYEGAPNQLARDQIQSEIDVRQENINLIQEEIPLLQERMRKMAEGASKFEALTGSLPSEAPASNSGAKITPADYPQIPQHMRDAKTENDNLAAMLQTDAEASQALLQQQLEQINLAEQYKLDSILPYQEMRERAEQAHIDRLAKINIKGQTEWGRMWNAGLQGRLQFTDKVLGQMASLMESRSRKMFEVGKAAAIAQALVNAYAAVNQVWADDSLPYYAKIVASVATGVATLANVQQIASTQFGGGGGSGTVNGGGATVGAGAPTQSIPDDPLEGQNLQLTVVVRDGDRRERTLEIIEDINELRREGAVIFEDAA